MAKIERYKMYVGGDDFFIMLNRTDLNRFIEVSKTVFVDSPNKHGGLG